MRGLEKAAVAITAKAKRFKWRPATKVIMYGASGLPIVCQPTEADKMILKHEESAFFADTPEEMTKYIRVLLDDERLREQMGKAAKKHTYEKASIDVLGRRLVGLFEDVGVKLTPKHENSFSHDTVQSVL